jgi:steroid 5-alpha reductase family enzyme
MDRARVLVALGAVTLVMMGGVVTVRKGTFVGGLVLPASSVACSRDTRGIADASDLWSTLAGVLELYTLSSAAKVAGHKVVVHTLCVCWSARPMSSNTQVKTQEKNHSLKEVPFLQTLELRCCRPHHSR